jgi:predicted PolB exonuclease-like 3'-5' exonuclease
MSKLPGKWKDVPIHKIINWLGDPTNVIDDNNETILDRCKRIEKLNQFVQPLMDNGALTSSAVREIWDMIKTHYTRKEQESMWADFWKRYEKKKSHEERKRKKKKKRKNKNKI